MAGLVQRAYDSWRAWHPHDDDSFWRDDECLHRLDVMRPFLVADLQRYWKRLRKAGHSFKYFVVVEPHPGRGAHRAHKGLPHLHWLLHEQGDPIRKRELQAKWPFGFSKVVIVGGRSKRAADPKKAAAYVAKYLSKCPQARQMASEGYRPLPRDG